MINTLGANRIIYGSDFPEVGIKESYELASKVLANLKPIEKEWIFGKTIASLLKIDDYAS